MPHIHAHTHTRGSTDFFLFMSASGSSGIDKPHIYTGTDFHVCVLHQSNKNKCLFINNKIKKTTQRKEGWGAEYCIPKKTLHIFTIHQEVLNDILQMDEHSLVAQVRYPFYAIFFFFSRYYSS